MKEKNMSQTYRITGQDAIRIAQRENLTLQCFANPLDDGGEVNLGVAIQIAKEDASLIYADVVANGGWRGSDGNYVDSEGRNVGDYFRPLNAGGPAEYLGPDDDGVEPSFDNA